MEEERGTRPNRFNVLIADDFDVERACYRRYLSRLKSYHYDFSEAETGVETIFFCGRFSIDVVLLDYSLPDCEAPVLIRQIALMGKSPLTIVTIDDCQAVRKKAAKAIRAGAQACLIKERITPENLQATIVQAIAKRSAYQLRQQLAPAL